MMTSSKRKKVLFVITKSNFGGAQRYVYDLASSLSKDRFEAVVAFGGTGTPGSSAGKLEAMLKKAGIRTIFIQNFARDIFIFKEFLALFELMSLFRKEKPDIIHLNSSKAGGLGALAGRLTLIPNIVYTSHGWAYNEPVSGVTKLFRWTAALATVFLCHKIISVSHFDMTHAPLGIKATAIHNGVAEFNFLPQGEARKELSERASVPDEAFIIGTIAELHPSKGLATLITSAVTLEGTQIIIMGEGQLRASLEALIRKHGLESRVHLLGFIDNAPTLLKAFDVFVLPSQKEGLGYVLLEAGSAGLPVIATTVGGIPEIIDDGISGTLITPNDPTGLAKAIQELIENPNTRRSYGETLQSKVARDFSLAEMVEKTVHIYTA